MRISVYFHAKKQRKINLTYIYLNHFKKHVYNAFEFVHTYN